MVGVDLDPAQGFVMARIMAAVKHELAWLENLNDPRGLYSYCFCELL